MKVGGRIIQNQNITVNSEVQFSATYKQHYIEIELLKTGHTNEYGVDVWYFNGGWAVQTIINRCTIHDAIIYALNGAML